jgi:hypothetical protein
VNELPEVRETLWLRLMGRGATRFRAVDELAALPADAWERRHIAPLLIELQRRLSKAQGERMLTQAERKQLERDRKAFEALETRGIKKGLAQGREQGLAQGREQGLVQGREQGLVQGREQGLAPLIRQFTRKLGRPVTDRERATLVRRLDSLGADRLGDVVLDLDAPALAAWLANPRAR